MKAWSISLILFMAQAVSVACASDDHTEIGAASDATRTRPAQWILQPGSLTSANNLRNRQGRPRMIDSPVSSSSSFLIDDNGNDRQDSAVAAPLIPSSNSIAGVLIVMSHEPPAQPHRSASSLRGLAKEAEPTMQPEQQKDDKEQQQPEEPNQAGGGEGGSSSKTQSPTRSPWVIPNLPLATPTNSPTGRRVFVTAAPVSKAPVSKAPISAAPISGAPVLAAPISAAPVVTPPVVVAPAPVLLTPPTADPATLAPIPTPPTTTLLPTFNNNRQTDTLTLNNFEISIKATAADNLIEKERAVIQVYQDHIRKATQVYLKETLPYENLLYVQLFPLEKAKRRRNLLDIAESFSYGGEAVFFHDGATPPDKSQLVQEQQRALNDTAAFQVYIYQMETLKDVKVIHAVLRDDDNERAADRGQPGTVNLIVIIAVASGVALAVLLLLIALLCKLCRRRHPPPPPIVTTNNNKKGKEEEYFNPYGEGTHTTDTEDEGAKPLEQIRRVDIAKSGSNATGETHVEGTFSSDTVEPPAITATTQQHPQSKQPRDDSLRGILRAKKRIPEQLYTVPMIEKPHESDDDSSMDGYSLGSGAPQGLQAQDHAKTATPPTWSSPSPASIYSSGNESQFSYNNIPGTKKNPAVSALGPTLSTDSLETTDDDEKDSGNTVKTRMVPIGAKSDNNNNNMRPNAVVSPPQTKGYIQQTPSKVVDSDDEDDDLFVVPPLESQQKERMTKGFEGERDSLPFDESHEDSMEQDLDVFSAELEKIKRDIAARRRLEQSSSGDDDKNDRTSRFMPNSSRRR